MPTTDPTFGWRIPELGDAPDIAQAVPPLAADIAATVAALALDVVEVEVTTGLSNNFAPVSDGCRYRYNRYQVDVAFRVAKSSGHTKNTTVAVYDLPPALAPKGGRANIAVSPGAGGGALAVRMGGYVQGTDDPTPGRLEINVLNDGAAWDSSVWIRIGGSWLRDSSVPLP